MIFANYRSALGASALAASLTICLAATAQSQQLELDTRTLEQQIEEVVALIEQMDPATFTLPANSQTQHFPLADGGLGQLAQAQAPEANGAGVFMLEATAGSALIQDYIPSEGPDCDADADEPLIVYYQFNANPDASLMSVNEAARLGAVIATGTAIKYRPGPNFCEDEAYISEAAKPAFLHVPFSPFGQNARNFQAMAASQNSRHVQAMFATSGFSARLGGYADARMLGQSAAAGDMGAGGAMAQAMLADVLADNPEAAAAMAQIPGAMPGANNEGSLQLDLSTHPMSEIAGQNAAFTYAQVRFVHTSAVAAPGSWLEDLQQAIRIEGALADGTPATPNGGSLED